MWNNGYTGVVKEAIFRSKAHAVNFRKHKEIGKERGKRNDLSLKASQWNFNVDW